LWKRRCNTWANNDGCFIWEQDLFQGTWNGGVG
jgi:hypothetical protein